MTRVRLLIADDHAIVREGLVAILNRQPDMTVVAEAADGAQAVSLWRQHRPDVSLLDLRMPALDGIGAIDAIRRVSVAARIIVLTTYDTDNDIYLAVRGGARAYLLKDAPREALLDCIRRVHAGETCIPPELAARLANTLSSEPALTARELEVLTLLARGNSNKQIAGALFISEATVKSHLRRVFTKLNVLSRTEAIAMATRRGIIQL